jgi:hypothetical protein
MVEYHSGGDITGETDKGPPNPILSLHQKMSEVIDDIVLVVAATERMFGCHRSLCLKRHPLISHSLHF